MLRFYSFCLDNGKRFSFSFPEAGNQDISPSSPHGFVSGLLER
jgi:hypothetical protein